ncbi:MAG: hypothetical protein M3162_06995 [Thermoproteota archaeon]|nr:hypothetical protein [Thermoproteota archaeon]
MLGNKKSRLSFIMLTVAAFAASLLLGPVASSIDDNMASAHKAKKCKDKEWKEDHKDYCKKHSKKNHGSGGGNNAEQSISQGQSSRQSSQCVSGGDMSGSCNNLSVQNQANSGNNAAGQQDDGDGNGGNRGEQGINQGQSSDQDAQCVSGEDAIVSCNNAEFQNLVNSGNNALGQR